MQNVFVLSHASDIDGVGSAALVKIKYSIPHSNMLFSDYSKQGLSYADRKLSRHYKKGITLFIADLGVHPGIVDLYRSILKSVKDGGGKVLWFDHHPWADESIKKLTPLCDAAIIGENSKYCATEITYRELGFKDAFTKKFVQIVHYSDFNIKPKSTAQRKAVATYALSITSYNSKDSWDEKMADLRHVAEVISKGDLFDSKVKADAARFDKINRSRTKQMVKALEIRKNVAVGFSKQVQSTYGCAAVIDASRKKIGIYVNTAVSRGHIRSTGPDISGLARSLGGGGHPHASGFDIDRKKFNGFKTQDDKSKFADFIQARIEKLGI